MHKNIQDSYYIRTHVKFLLPLICSSTLCYVCDLFNSLYLICSISNANNFLLPFITLVLISLLLVLVSSHLQIRWICISYNCDFLYDRPLLLWRKEHTCSSMEEGGSPSSVPFVFPMYVFFPYFPKIELLRCLSIFV